MSGLLPLLVQCRKSEISLGREEMVEAPFFHPRVITEFLDTHSSIAAGIDEVEGAVEELFFCAADSSMGDLS